MMQTLECAHDLRKKLEKIAMKAYHQDAAVEMKVDDIAHLAVTLGILTDFIEAGELYDADTETFNCGQFGLGA